MKNKRFEEDTEGFLYDDEDDTPWSDLLKSDESSLIEATRKIVEGLESTLSQNNSEKSKIIEDEDITYITLIQCSDIQILDQGYMIKYMNDTKEFLEKVGVGMQDFLKLEDQITEIQQRAIDGPLEIKIRVGLDYPADFKTLRTPQQHLDKYLAQVDKVREYVKALKVQYPDVLFVVNETDNYIRQEVTIKENDSALSTYRNEYEAIFEIKIYLKTEEH